MSEKAINAAIEAANKTRPRYCGFYYTPRHVIRDLRADDNQEIWQMEGAGEHYQSAHDAMMEELERIAMRAAIAAYKEQIAAESMAMFPRGIQ
jgi:hypothetical protein